MKEFFKGIIKYASNEFYSCYYSRTFFVRRFFAAYDLAFNEVAKKQIAIKNLLLLSFIAVLMYVVFGMMFKMDYDDTKREISK